MAGRTDIHCHLLPGVDDGAADLGESIAMAADAGRDGTGTVVATPHVRLDHVVDVTDLPDRVRELAAELRRAGLALALRCGGELGHEMVGRLSQPELETIALGPPHARWLLLETPFSGIDDEFHAAADELRDRGFGVVLAHPERARGVTDHDFRALRRELAAGSLAQVNVWALAGRQGADAEMAAAELIRRGLAGAIASDSHPGWKTPTLTTAHAAAERHGLDPKTLRRLTGSAPTRLLARGLPLSPELAAA
jgi:protein-tyrosine phosphatase